MYVSTYVFDATVLEFEAMQTISGRFITHRHELCHPSSFYIDAISCRASTRERKPPHTPDLDHCQTVLEFRSTLSDDFSSDRSPGILLSRY